MMSGFGLCIPKAAGKAAHPDVYDNVAEMSNQRYLKQLQAFKDWAGAMVYECSCSRPELLVELK